MGLKDASRAVDVVNQLEALLAAAGQRVRFGRLTLAGWEIESCEGERWTEVRELVRQLGLEDVVSFEAHEQRLRDVGDPAPPRRRAPFRRPRPVAAASPPAARASSPLTLTVGEAIAKLMERPTPGPQNFRIDMSEPLEQLAERMVEAMAKRPRRRLRVTRDPQTGRVAALEEE